MHRRIVREWEGSGPVFLGPAEIAVVDYRLATEETVDKSNEDEERVVLSKTVGTVSVSGRRLPVGESLVLKTPDGCLQFVLADFDRSTASGRFSGGRWL